MAARIAWVLNLDADLELGAGPEYEPTTSVRRAMRAPVAALARSLLRSEDALVDEARPAHDARGLLGRAFCPTPRALALLRRAGAHPEAHPPVEVLRRVNSRAFAAELGTTLPDAAFVTDFDVARTMLRDEPAMSSTWRVKHAFGMAGRNQRVIVPGALGDRDAAFVKAGLAQGGAQIEPNIAIEAEYAVHGLIAEDGSSRLGELVRQRCDPRGAWTTTERIAHARGALGNLSDRLANEAGRVARALIGAGFFGPFGVDAYTYRDREGVRRLQPRSEINARYSMGFATGFGSLDAPSR